MSRQTAFVGVHDMEANMLLQGAVQQSLALADAGTSGSLAQRSGEDCCMDM